MNKSSDVKWLKAIHNASIYNFINNEKTFTSMYQFEVNVFIFARDHF